MRVFRCFLPALVAALFWAPASASQPSLAEPSLSPDGREIAFVSGGQIWTVPASGGTARVLVSDGATDERPMFSPDGRKLAYISSKTGNGDIYVLALATGVVSRLTYDDGYDELDAWSPDGAWLYFANGSRNIYGARDIYRVRANGGTPMRVVSQPYINVYLAAASPRGDELAFNARGFAGNQWWRKGHSHLDECEIWIRRGLTGNGTYERITAGEAKDQWPMWSANGRTIYFTSDRTGAQNLWSAVPGAGVHELTHFSSGRVVWPSIATNGSGIVFERGFGVWRYDLNDGRVARVPIALEGAVQMPRITHETLTNHFITYTLSPDGKKLAFIARGQLFAAAADGGSAFHVSTGADYALGAIAWAPDSNTLAYVAGHGHEGELRTYDFLNDRQRRLTASATDIRFVQYRPHEDGRADQIAYEQGGAEVRVVDTGDGHIQTLARAPLPWEPIEPDRPLQWSPDGRWLAFFVGETHGFTNVHVVDAEHPSERPISFFS